MNKQKCAIIGCGFRWRDYSVCADSEKSFFRACID